MYYLLPSDPSVRRSLRLFGLLSSSQDHHSPMTKDSEIARLFASAGNWSPQDRLLFVTKLYQPRRLVESRFTNDRTEVAQVRELRRDLEYDQTSTEELLRLHVPGPGSIYGISSLAAQIFLGQASMFGANLSSPWRALCIEALRAGSDPHFVPEGTDGWATMLGSSLHRLISTLHKLQKGWDETLLVAQTCIRQWNLLLVEAGFDVDECVSREHQAWVKSRLHRSTELHRELQQLSTPHGTHWKQFKERVVLGADLDGALCAHSGVSNSYWDLWDDKCLANVSQESVASSSSANMADDEHSTTHIPGSFPPDKPVVARSSPEHNNKPTSAHGPDAERITPTASTHSSVLTPERADARPWSDVQVVLAKSAEAEAYRKLRFGVEGLAHPSRYNGGHGTTCGCTRCTREREKIRANIEREYRVIYNSTPNSFYRVDDHGQPRDPGNG
jgi:hypothetical protein